MFTNILNVNLRQSCGIRRFCLSRRFLHCLGVTNDHDNMVFFTVFRDGGLKIVTAPKAGALPEIRHLRTGSFQISAHAHVDISCVHAHVNFRADSRCWRVVRTEILLPCDYGTYLQSIFKASSYDVSNISNWHYSRSCLTGRQHVFQLTRRIINWRGMTRHAGTAHARRHSQQEWLKRIWSNFA